MFKEYYELAKPGIIYGNALTAAAGFFLASTKHIDWILLPSMLIGLSFVIGSACVFNNYIDSDIDHEMERTKDRATVVGSIAKNAVLIYGTCLLLVGVVILFLFTNMLTLIIALLGVVIYVGLYTPLKRKSIHSTIVGSIAGATPPVIGYCAVTNTFNLEALLLFLILVFWQMPHFYAIAVYRRDEYAAALIPVLPLKKNQKTVTLYVVMYIAAFIITSVSLTTFGFTGFIYLVVMVIVGMLWLRLGLQGFEQIVDQKKWARKVFLFSLIVVTVLSMSLSFGARVP